MKKILIIDGGVDFHGRGGTLNHTYADLAQKILTGMGHEVTVTRVQGEWVPAEEAEKVKAADIVMLNFAAWWMGTPWPVKRYIDEVFCAGLSAGGDGRTRLKVLRCEKQDYIDLAVCIACFAVILASRLVFPNF